MRRLEASEVFVQKVNSMRAFLDGQDHVLTDFQLPNALAIMVNIYISRAVHAIQQLVRVVEYYKLYKFAIQLLI